ncbi:acyl-CoA dehydrogenase C-terminal domain-containing protein [Oceanibacterium hippocampi]|uniref:3-methylmercaptopropionyl-CoA dehydrogenase n=1 Tax=Oceanibacterium hippocampi TaxID=745714 RepID=A0A1Y5SBG4_9PROT|nr:acyl-CoA dehydrogenase C-terminal domain-containing protein [Oceanibacterium hippocampi]SLN35798.1 Acyl-CoA dehydrogenase, short-chain specific [Oceanibacterium hippocampi]
MADYRAPLGDMRFVLNNIVDLKALAALPGLDAAEPELVDAVLEEAGKMASQILDPINYSGDRTGSRLADGVVTTPPGYKEAYRAYVEGGWNGMPFDPEYGGGGLPWAVTLAAMEMWNSANLAFSLCPLLNQGAIEALEAHGSDELKATYLAKMVSGEWSATMNLTEPSAGSDVGALRSKAEPRGDGTYRISGQKIFITYGEHDMAENIVHLVLARLPDAPPGTRGISLFVVPKFLVEADGSLGRRNDVRCVSLEEKLGIHGSPTCVMSYGDEGDCVGYLLGAENKGMRCMFTMMNAARISVGLQGLAIAERAYQRALAFAAERRQGRTPGMPATESAAIIEHADVRRNLMLMKSQVEAMRCLLYVNGAALDAARHHPDPAVREARQALTELLTPISKAWSTDLGCEIASIGVQIHGGMGFVEETGAAQYYRDARILPIYEGTNGIQAIDLVGRKLPMLGGETVRELIAEMRATAEALSGAGGDLGAIADPLSRAADVVAETSDWLLANMANDPNAGLAGATPFLKLFGYALGGHFLGRSALAANAALNGGAGNREQLEAKIVTARFYATQVLPQVDANRAAAMAGPELLFAIGADALAS